MSHTNKIAAVTEKLLSTREVAEQLGLTSKGVLNLARKCKIGYIRMGNKLKYRPAAVALFIAQREVNPK